MLTSQTWCLVVLVLQSWYISGVFYQGKHFMSCGLDVSFLNSIHYLIRVAVCGLNGSLYWTVHIYNFWTELWKAYLRFSTICNILNSLTQFLGSGLSSGCCEEDQRTPQTTKRSEMERFLTTDSWCCRRRKRRWWWWETRHQCKK